MYFISTFRLRHIKSDGGDRRTSVGAKIRGLEQLRAKF